MNMGGPSGLASRVAGRPDEWRFSVDFGMAAPWTLRVQLSGGVSGAVNASVVVGEASGASSNAKPKSGTQSINPMSNTGLPSAGMGAMAPSGDWTAWRTAAFVLVGLGLIALVVLRRDRRTATISLFALAAVVVLAITMARAQYSSPPMDMNAMENVSGTAPVAVKTIRVRSGFQNEPVVAPGTVLPYLSQSIMTRASGILSGFNLYNGDRVQAGEQIAFLDAAELGSSAAAAQAAAQAAQIQARQHAPLGVDVARNDLIAARTGLVAAQADVSAKAAQIKYWSAELARERTLLSAGAVSQQEYQDELAQQAGAQAAYDAARQQVASMQAALQSARDKASDAVANVGSAQASYEQAQNEAQTQATLAGYRSVIAPDDAVIVKRLVDPGTYVQSGTPIAQIAVLDRLRVQASVAQADLPRVSIGDVVAAAMPNGTVVHGRVSSVQPVADPTTHTAMVEAIVENPHNRLQPGGYVRVTIHSRGATLRSGDAVPAVSVVGGATTPIVYTVKNGTAQPVHVFVISNDGVTAIVRGLPENAHVVTDGAADLQPGQAVTDIGL